MESIEMCNTKLSIGVLDFIFQGIHSLSSVPGIFDHGNLVVLARGMPFCDGLFSEGLVVFDYSWPIERFKIGDLKYLVHSLNRNDRRNCMRFIYLHVRLKSCGRNWIGTLPLPS